MTKVKRPHRLYLTYASERSSKYAMLTWSMMVLSALDMDRNEWLSVRWMSETLADGNHVEWQILAPQVRSAVEKLVTLGYAERKSYKLANRRPGDLAIYRYKITRLGIQYANAFGVDTGAVKLSTITDSRLVV